MGWQKEIAEDVKKAKDTSLMAMDYTTQQKNKFLDVLSTNISRNTKKILSANSRDIKNVMKNKYSSAFSDRLMLTNERISKILE
ncbi:MAG: hypothetical protein PHI44_05415, partial [Candidatus Ratteibacteria bacterium]|nr:hypothetical protein [Candidatus Ratteibacteria bacterium]